MSDETPLDSSKKIEELRSDFDDDGIMSSENIQFMFDYIAALELALEFSAGAGLTQEESDAADESRSNYMFEPYVAEAIEQKAKGLQ